MVRKEDLPTKRFMSLHTVEGEMSSLMPATYEFQDRFLDKRTKAIAFAPACLYLMKSAMDLEARSEHFTTRFDS